ncbi:hypothetical protein T07_7869 [Trichinella nelsoni]|uniref:Uncharacterized protein n=1 Tax=Trichinella nelsoni TaxID=6336 RepID=A0A0V0SDN6_9BILA|nr:hypothetical protein T07_7869 [Trichinella nelsoni]
MRNLKEMCGFKVQESLNCLKTAFNLPNILVSVLVVHTALDIVAKYLFNLALFLRLVSVYQGTIYILAKEATLILLNEI